MCSRISWCFGKSYFIKNFRSITRTYEKEERDYINLRYLRIVKNLETTTKRSAFFYYLFSSIVTTGSILVPSLISIQERPLKSNPSDSEKQDHSNKVYWSVWIISITITFANGFMKLLRLDQTYISRNLRLNQLRSEGVMFISETGDYEGVTDRERFKRFVANVEKIKHQQMQQEYTQSDLTIERESNRSVTNNVSLNDVTMI